MILEMTASALISYGALASQGTSETARFVAEEANRGRRQLGESFALGLRARGVFEALPLGTPPPTVGAETDGHLTLEWYRSTNRVLSVSVSPEGLIYYAALLGTSKRSGTEPFRGEIPEDIMRITHRLFAA